LFRANLRAHSFSPPFDLMNSVKLCPTGFCRLRRSMQHKH
jgi:hypothetical protein